MKTKFTQRLLGLGKLSMRLARTFLENPHSRHPLIVLGFSGLFGIMAFPISSKYSDVRAEVTARKEVLNELVLVSARAGSAFRTIDQMNQQRLRHHMKDPEFINMEKTMQESINTLHEALQILDAHIAFNFNNNEVGPPFLKFRELILTTVGQMLDDTLSYEKKHVAFNKYNETAMADLLNIVSAMKSELDLSVWNTIVQIFFH